MRRSPLHELHRRLDARFVDFAGFRLPLHYREGLIREHLHTREQAGLFDISHIAQLQIQGPGLTSALEALLPADLQGLPAGRMVYSLLTNENGGVRDDLILYSQSPEHVLLALNAAQAEQDAAYLRERLPETIDARLLEDRALLALQGPQATSVMERLAPGAERLPFMSGCQTQLAGIPCLLMRCGYTGEDGFEISLPVASAEDCALRLLEFEQVRVAGLGARDSLRLEAGLCLYGRDLDQSITPVEADLAWTVAKARRRNGERSGGFPGADVILEQIENGAPRRRVGLRVCGRAPLRDGVRLLDQEDNPVGAISSGGFAPSLDAPVAMGYLDAGCLRDELRLHASVRGRTRELRITSLPFVPHRYRQSARASRGD